MQSFSRFFSWLKHNFGSWQFLLFLIANIAVRLYNYQHTLYFIWDQGRDAWAIDRIVHGDLTLIGPTSGLHGFFLGPLWFYLGVPGYLLSDGSPYGIALGYIALSLLALPLMWLMAHRLFVKKPLAIFTAWLMAFHFGSILSTLTIWNPLIALPLMAATWLAFFKARHSRIWLALAFLLLALVLQAEFAYAIFFVVTLWLLLPWIRQRWSVVDAALAILMVAATGIPQMLFELRNNFIMTKSLWIALQDPERTIRWANLWQDRPGQLWYSTQHRLFGGHPWGDWLMWAAAALLAFGVWQWWRERRTVTGTTVKAVGSSRFAWQLLGVFALIPYAWYLFWRGNYGHFFEYYLTAHFFFLIPWMVLGAWYIKQNFLKNRDWYVPALATWSFFALWLAVTLNVIWGVILFPNNRAGLYSMNQSISRLFAWSEQDQADPAVFRIFTPNLQSENYDFLIHWQARQRNGDVPRTTRQSDDEVWYILIEPDFVDSEIRFDPWYREATASGQRVRQEFSKVHLLETWMTPEKAYELGFSPIATAPADALRAK